MEIKLDQNYLDKFFGDPSVIADMDDTELRAAIHNLRRQWEWDGYYDPETDPSEQEIYDYAIIRYGRPGEGKG